MDIIITSPSLDPKENVSGISSVTQFIISNNRECHYLHFELGRKDKEKGGWYRIPSLVRKYREWKKMLREHPEAMVHYNFPLSKSSLMRDPWFMRYALRRKRKMVVHVHGGLFLTAPRIPGYLMRIMRWVFAWDVPFIVLSDMEREIVTRRLGARHVEVLPNCVDLGDAADFAQDQEARKAPGVEVVAEDKPLRIGYLGRIEPNKGMSELMDACGRLKEEGVNFQLVFAGKEQTEGEYLPRFAQRIGDNFEYAGLVSGKVKCDFLRSLDAFVMPTYFEGLPMSLLECMSYGVTPIVTPVGSIPQVVKDGENGILVKVRDCDSIVGAVKRLDGNREWLRTLGMAARQTIFDQFSPEKYIEKLNRIYDELDS